MIAKGFIQFYTTRKKICMCKKWLKFHFIFSFESSTAEYQPKCEGKTTQSTHNIATTDELTVLVIIFNAMNYELI